MSAEKSKIIVDLNTKIIDQNKRIYACFSGKDYRFFTHFISRGVIFGDFPGVDVRQFEPSIDDELRRWLAISEKIRSYYVRHQDEPKYPSKDPSDYSGYKWTGPRLNAKGVFNGIYHRANRGDLIIVTSPGGAYGTTHIGEFADTPLDIFNEQFHRYKDEPIPARRVNWLGKIENIKLPQELVKQLTSPNAFSLVKNSHYDLIFSAVYENYVRTDISNSLFDIQAENFSTVPDMFLKLIANMAAEIARSCENDEYSSLKDSDIISWLTGLDNDNFVADQKININSPGINILKSEKITPILAAVLFSVCLLSADDITSSEIVFTNSANGGVLDECDIPVAENAKVGFKIMSLAKLELLCKAAKKAESLGQIKTPITVNKQKAAEK